MPQSKQLYLSALVPLGVVLLISVVTLFGAASTELAQTLMGLNALVAVVGLFLATTVIRNVFATLGAEPVELRGTAEALANDQLDRIEASGAEPGTLMAFLLGLRDRLVQSEEQSDFNTRIRQAIDCADTNIMIADADRNVVYMNDSVTQMLRDAEGEIRKDLPSFSVQTVLNGSIDRFHKNPAHQMHMLDQLTDTHRTQINLGQNTFGLIANPIFAEDGKRLGTVVEWKDLTAENLARDLAVFNTRIRQAIDCAETNIMIADTDRNVVYMNESVTDMLRESQSEIRRDLPDFDVDRVLNGSIDRFHKNPAHQMKMLDQLNDTHKTEIKLGDSTFGLIANPIFSEDGERLGTVVEWKDRTKEIEAEQAAVANARIRQAINCAKTNIMIADTEREVVYMNEAVTDMLRNSQSEIRRDLPQFDVDKVLNGSIDRFHKNPAHQMKMLNELTGTYNTEIKLGDTTFGLIANPIFSEDGDRLGTVVEWKDRTQEIEAESAAIYNTRIRQAVDNSSNNIMIADADRNVVYMNKAVEGMLRNSQAEIRRDLPQFDVDKVLNGSIDRFHKNPAHQMNMLSSLQGTHRAQITLGEKTFGLIANPIFGANNERLGTVVEWLDRTDELKAANDVTTLVDAASAGDFSLRIPKEGKEGFFLELTNGLNQVMETSDNALSDIARVLEAIAEGDLTERVTADYQGTFLKMKDFCNRTTENLTQMIGEIRAASDTIQTASSEISQGNADLSSRTEQQASSLEETASSIEELTSTVRTNTDNAKQANVLAEQATNVATDGGDLIRQVVTNMESINESAQKISDIIGVIDGIAFQTNILALNAAVEAARAGEQGRGFAVVASEVRTLAQRSADAAKDIKQLISDSVAKIEGGNALVNKSGETMDEIVTSIKRVNDIMSEIAAASVEQASGIEEVNTAVGQMDEMTQQTAALVEQAAAAAQSLLGQAGQLQRNVSVFRLDDSALQATAATAPREGEPRAPSGKPTLRPVKTQPPETAKPAKAQRIQPPRDDDEDDWESF
ncbi:MAG: methyl-accepting chemotaxis protein [Marinobacter sp.]|nr:methyl-accepting chemotaxis protein [Marinobacter sp.]MDX1756112.1 methyl-accepting chemotaxis protein [Marinobacter sp.]